VTGRLDKAAWAPVVAYDRRLDLRLSTWASAEAQVAALADDIAYNNHDVDDGLQAGILTIAELMEVPLIGPVLKAAWDDFPEMDERMLRLEAVRRMIGVMVNDVIVQTKTAAVSAKVETAEDVRMLGRKLVSFSPDVTEDLSRLSSFLYAKMYRNFRVNRSRSASKRMIAQLFDLFMTQPDVLPAEWADAGSVKGAARARIVCDYIAGMTDRFAIEEHRKLFHMDV